MCSGEWFLFTHLYLTTEFFTTCYDAMKNRECKIYHRLMKFSTATSSSMWTG